MDKIKKKNKLIECIKKNKIIIPAIFIILVSIIISIPMLRQDFNMQQDDGIQHICRLIGTYSSVIEDKEIFPVIISKFCNNFGYSWNLFYSPLTAYVPLIFKIFNLSFTMCLKLFCLLISILTGFSMYFFVKKVLSNIDIIENRKIEAVSILSAILYILVPYRLNDMYIRLAIAELCSFIFIPMIFNGLYSIINLKKKTNLLAYGASLMLLSHSMLTVYLALFCLIYVIVNIKKLDKWIIIQLLKNTLIILLLSAFYTIPLLESKISADYEVFNESHMLREDALIVLKPNILEIFFQKQGRMIYGLGIVTIIGCVYSIFAIKKLKEKKNIILFLVLGLICTIMSLDIFPFEKLPSFFTMMQFSFRLLEFASFFLVVVCSVTIGVLVNKMNIYTTLGLTCLSILLLLPSLDTLRYDKMNYEESELKEGVRVTSNTGRVHAGLASFEYLPTKAFNNRSYLENREDIPIILNNVVDTENEKYIISNYIKDGTNCTFNLEINQEVDNNIDNEKESIIIELSYIYYIGYTAVCEYENKDGEIKKEYIRTEESDNGFVQIELKDEEIQKMQNIKISVNYTGTILMIISYSISILTVIFLILQKGYIEYKRFRNTYKK